LEVADRKMVQECTGLAECLAGCGAGDTACRKSCRDHATSGAESNYASLKSCAESNGCQAGALDSACLKDNCSSERSACRQLSEQADVEGYVRLVPKEPLPKRARFAAFVTSGVTNRDRMPLKAPAAVRMAIQPHPVFEDGESTVASLSAEQAKGIQNQLRPVLQPLASTVESKTDVDRSDIVGLWTWTTWTDTFVQFDPGGGVLPFPNEFVRQGMNGRVSIPTDGATGLQKTLIETLNRRQGFSTTAPGWIPVDGPIDEASLSPSSVPLLWIPGSRKYGGDHYSLNYRSKWNQLTFRPEQPLEKDDAYVDEPNTLAFNTGVVTTDLKGGNGHPVRPSASFVFLRSRHPLIANGDIKVEQLQSQVDSGELKKSDVQLLESARQTFNQLLPLAKGLAGVESRDQVASAFAFHPENMPQAVQDARARAIASFEARSKGAKRADRSSGKSWSAVSDPGQSYTGPGGGWPAVDMSGVARIQWTASFETVRMLKPEQQTDGRLRDQSNLTTEKVGISVFLPRQSPPQGGNGGRAYCHSPAPVVVAQHGLGSARVEAGMALANQLAQRGIAVVTMDFLGHGGRTDGASTLHPPQTPSKSGEGFLTKNVVRSKNRVLQSIVDVAVLARLIRRGGLESAVDADQATDCFRDGSNAGLGYVGHSLGGFVGAPLLAVDPTVKVGVLNGAGGRYSRILTEGALGGSLEQALTDAGLKKGSFGRFRALAFVQWIADHVDPLAFAPFLTRASLDVRTFDSGNGFSTGDSVGGNELLVQMLEKPGTGDDDVVPNATTEAFAEAAQPGVPLDQATFPGDHGLLFDLDPGNRADSVRCARRQLAAWLKSGLTGKAEIPDSLKAGNCLGGGP
ncbi:MAG: alpha/beta fold hydrolase, partial [Bradymonadaceae bacterium]